MGRKSLKDAVAAVIKDATSGATNEFNVKVTDTKGKSWIGFIKARNQDTAITQMRESLGVKGKDMSFEIV